MVKKALILSLLIPIICKAQFNGKKFGVGLNAVYTTTAKIYLSPNSSDPVIRNSSFPVDGIVNPSIYFNYLIFDDLIISFSTEYMEKTSTGNNLTAFSGDSTVSVQLNDGFRLIPIELSIYYVLPFSSEKFKYSIGGGVAYYYGKHIRTFSDESIKTIERKFAYGIQVSVAVDYLITSNLGFHSEMKFRDPQFNLKSQYEKMEVQYRGKTIRLGQNTFDSKVNIDGVTFVLGLAYYF